MHAETRTTGWVELAAEAPIRPDIHRWLEIELGRFVPAHGLDGGAGERGLNWLREAVARDCVPFSTQIAVGEDGAMQGFLAMQTTTFAMPVSERVRLEWGWIGRRLPTGDQPGALLHWIVRSAETQPGFGMSLFRRALRVAESNPLHLAVFVNPDNDRLARMWQEQYLLRPMNHPKSRFPDLLWTSLGKPPTGCVP